MPFIPFIGLSILIHLSVILTRKILSIFKKSEVEKQVFLRRTVDGIIKRKRERLYPIIEFESLTPRKETRLAGLMIISFVFTFVFTSATKLLSVSIESKHSSAHYIASNIHLLGLLFSETGLAINSFTHQILSIGLL